MLMTSPLAEDETPKVITMIQCHFQVSVKIKCPRCLMIVFLNAVTKSKLSFSRGLASSSPYPFTKHLSCSSLFDYCLGPAADSCLPTRLINHSIHFHFRCPCWTTCLGDDCLNRWTYVRTAVLSVVDTPAFEWIVLVLIFASSITLCFEDIHLDSNLTLKRVLYWTNFAFSMIFVIEMVLKWIALGFTKYFTSFWTILDFIIVFVRIH